jgi:hypothetical protein
VVELGRVFEEALEAFSSHRLLCRHLRWLAIDQPGRASVMACGVADWSTTVPGMPRIKKGKWHAAPAETIDGVASFEWAL